MTDAWDPNISPQARRLIDLNNCCTSCSSRWRKTCPCAYPKTKAASNPPTCGDAMKIGRKYRKKAARQQDLVERVLTQQRQEAGVVRDLSFKQFIQLAMPSFQFYTGTNLSACCRKRRRKLRRLMAGATTAWQIRTGCCLPRTTCCATSSASWVCPAIQRNWPTPSAVRPGRTTKVQVAGSIAASAVGFWETEARGGCWSEGSGGSITGKAAT